MDIPWWQVIGQTVASEFSDVPDLALVILSLVPVVVKAIDKPEPRTLLPDETPA